MKAIFDYLRKISGGKLTQKQVDAADIAIARASDTIIADMLGIAIANSMTVSQSGIDLICTFEGYSAKAYLCPAKVWTIGYGTTVYPNGQKVKPSDTCALAQARTYLQHDLKQFEKAVNDAVTAPLTQNQFDALVSLVYNIGAGNFKNSTLLKKLNAGDYAGAAAQFDVWINAAGKRVAGLVNRRAKEKMLFLK